MSVALVVEDQSDSSDPIESLLETVGVTKNIDRLHRGTPKIVINGAMGPCKKWPQIVHG